LFEAGSVVGLDGGKALIESGADGFEFNSLPPLRVTQLLKDRGAQGFGALIGLHSVALEAGGKFFAEGAGGVCLRLAHASQVGGLRLTEAREIVSRGGCGKVRARTQQKNDE